MFGIERRFGSITGPGLDERHINKSMLVRRALLENPVAAAEAVVIGDRAADVQAARNNGVPSIAVTWGYGTPDEFHDADWVVETWNALVDRAQRRPLQNPPAESPPAAPATIASSRP